MSEFNSRKFLARLAGPEDGPQLELLAMDNDFWFEGLNIDWTDVSPYWIVIEHDGEIVAGCQACPSKPVGRIEILMLDSRLGMVARGIAYKMLVNTASNVLKAQGVQILSGLIPLDMPEYMDFVIGRGWVKDHTCDVVFLGLRDVKEIGKQDHNHAR